MNKKAIIFDLDETLRKLRFNTDYSKVIGVTLRPHIDELLKKLQEVKQEGIDPIICTTANAESAQKYFIDILPEEYRDVFVQIYSKENPIKPQYGSIEYEKYMLCGNKPVTALEDYDQILFFDDNDTERNYLQRLFEDENTAPNKQVVFSNLYFDMHQDLK